MLVFVLLGLAGATGRGPFTKVDAGDRNVFALSYDRVIRHGADTRITMIAGPRPDRDAIRVFVTAEYLEAFEIIGILPEPVSSGARGDELYYDFALDSLQSTRITLHLDVRDYWFARARISAGDAPPLDIRQLILP